MLDKINSKCRICGEPIVKCENTCSCLPCKKEIKDCKNCFNEIFYCFSCKIKCSRNKEMKHILLERRAEKLEEVREIEQELGIYFFENDIMFQ
jgi:hypothetical protein